jgi:hypothetical protein
LTAAFQDAERPEYSACGIGYVSTFIVRDTATNLTKTFQIIQPDDVRRIGHIAIESTLQLALWVTNTYDISIVKTAITDASDICKFFFNNKDVQSDILSQRFSYTVRINARQSEMIWRIQKYLHRDYDLYKVMFEDSSLVITVGSARLLDNIVNAQIPHEIHQDDLSDIS